MKLLVLLINRRQAGVKCQGKPRATDTAAPNPKTRSCQFFECIRTEKLVNKIRWGKQCKVFRVYFLTRHRPKKMKNELNSLVVLSLKRSWGVIMRMNYYVAAWEWHCSAPYQAWLAVAEDTHLHPIQQFNGQQPVCLHIVWKLPKRSHCISKSVPKTCPLPKYSKSNTKI